MTNCLVTKSKFRKECLDIIQASILEWDHNNPLEKSKSVSVLWNDTERATEIEKCTLRCIICHRLKTWKCADGIKTNPNYKGPVMRKRLLEYLQFKKERLESDENKGECISYFNKCPMKQTVQSFLQMSNKDFDTKIPMDLLVLMLFDFDHLDGRAKIGQVRYLRSVAEDLKCQLRCCVYHRAKTMVEGDSGNVAWVAY